MCGIAFIRLRKPLGYYIEKYDTPSYGINKLFLLMEKQHNRGQDGAGVAAVKLNVQPGKAYIDRLRSIEEKPITDIFSKIGKGFNKIQKKNKKKSKDPFWIKENVPFAGEILMGHLRYGTYGKNKVDYCHPRKKASNWKSRTLLIAGNFNMTNNDELFERLVQVGQHPKEKVDTVTVLEEMGYNLDKEHERLWKKYDDGKRSNQEVVEKIETNIDLQKVVTKACKDFDGGYAMVGTTGYGGSFVARDPIGIRPAYYYADDEVIVVASEKPAIKTAFNIDFAAIKEIKPAHALIIDKDANFKEVSFIDKQPKKACSFERIYFSRGTDPSIHNERKELGRLLSPQILEAIGNDDFENVVFSYIPNTAETAFSGMMKGMENHLTQKRLELFNKKDKISQEEVKKMLSLNLRVEKLIVKDSKLRTFIIDDAQRNDFVAHIYDTTYEVIKKGEDTLVVIDDSIVRGTTLERSIIHILDRLEPKNIIIVSSSPQIRYPDCYAIDMSKMYEFVAFRAVIALLKDKKMTYLLDEVYQKCKNSLNLPLNKIENHVKEIYQPFAYEEVSDKIAEMISKDYKTKVKVVYQTIDNLHQACPNHLGDWYFTGNYPTSGGNRVANRAFINFMEGRKERAY
jgi:amidophosphoribosyltransferase